MTLVHPDSLAQTLDAVYAALEAGNPLDLIARETAARWIAGRQGAPGAYAGMFAPTAHDYRTGVRVFTGECVRSRAATGHILGEEACRALALLDVALPEVTEALARGSTPARRFADPHCGDGFYCCGICSVSLWRHLATGLLPAAEARLTHGVQVLQASRKGEGHWRRFPDYYTLLAIVDLDLPAVLDEMRYAAPRLERALRAARGTEPYTARRRRLIERVLARV